MDHATQTSIVLKRQTKGKQRKNQKEEQQTNWATFGWHNYELRYLIVDHPCQHPRTLGE